MVDLFCGIGGMTHGFIKENFNVVAGLDLDPDCKYAYEESNGAKFIEADLKKYSLSKLKQEFGDAKYKILIGCAPCQPFSQYTHRYKNKGKWDLLYSFTNIINHIEPDIVSMENVPGLLHYKNYSVYDDFKDNLTNSGYEITENIVYCPDYGIPQTRRRLVLLASKLGKIDLIKGSYDKSNYKTVRDTIGQLEPLENGQISDTDPLHRTSKLSNKNLKRIKFTLEGGGWKDWPQSLVLDCHKKDSGKSYGSVYGRMIWDKPSPTITTQSFGYGNGRFGHPDQDRALTLREAALLQTFPPDYIFTKIDDFKSIRTVMKHIGNAVPPVLGRVIAKSILDHLEVMDGGAK